MEKLLLVGLIASLPLAAFGMAAKITGSKSLIFFLFKLPSIIVLVVTIVYFLKAFKII
jgi:hypothetical protein